MLLWSDVRPFHLLALLCTLLLAAGAHCAEETANSQASSALQGTRQSLSSASDTANVNGEQEDEESNWDYLKRFYDLGPEKRAYSYVSEFKRLPVYNFGLGKRADSSGRLYSFGLGKREKNSRQYSFGLGKRPNNLYSFGLGKRAMDYPEENTLDTEDDDIEDLDELSEDKRVPAAYSFGLGKRYSQNPYSFGLGKRAPLYSFGLGKRGPSSGKQYSFGLGKREGRQYSFGLGKREISKAEMEDYLKETLIEQTAPENNGVAHENHVIKRRSASSEDLEWADAEQRRAEVQRGPDDASEFGRAGRRTYSFGLGKRLPKYSFGVGKRFGVDGST